MPRWGVRVCAVAPPLVVSTAATCLVGALLPPPAAWVLFAGGLVTVLLLLCGRGEAVAARLLCRSRQARPEELAVLAPALTLLSRPIPAQPPS